VRTLWLLPYAVLRAVTSARMRSAGAQNSSLPVAVRSAGYTLRAGMGRPRQRRAQVASRAPFTGARLPIEPPHRRCPLGVVSALGRNRFIAPIQTGHRAMRSAEEQAAQCAPQKPSRSNFPNFYKSLWRQGRGRDNAMITFGVSSAGETAQDEAKPQDTAHDGRAGSRCRDGTRGGGAPRRRSKNGRRGWTSPFRGVRLGLSCVCNS
jgi:hypothetical protein